MTGEWSYVDVKRKTDIWQVVAEQKEDRAHTVSRCDGPSVAKERNAANVQ